MAKILLLNPNKWGRGITAIWIPSHASMLKSHGHEVLLFDATFYRNWTFNEVAFNTTNQQYKPTKYEELIKWNTGNIKEDLKGTIDTFKPDIVFWSGLSSHIHGEGEYVNIEYGYNLLDGIEGDFLKIAGGLQPLADPKGISEKYPNIDILCIGESEISLSEIACNLSTKEFDEVAGILVRKESKIILNKKNTLIKDLDIIPPYDYSVFNKQVFLRPYNGAVINGVDYEMSRGCIYTCSYCVETVIQKYYGFTESSKSGVLKNFKQYLRCKSAIRIYNELAKLNRDYNVELIRCQDTNFLTIDKEVLNELADLFEENPLNIKLYIETRPEGINDDSVKLLKRLQVDGVGMGVEMSSEYFRKGRLHRYTSQNKIIDAFNLLKKYEIKRTSYNIIGIPEETEEMLLETIQFNQILNPDNMTVAFYSPYLGTDQQKIANNQEYFDDYQSNVDGQLRSLSKSTLLSVELLEFYKKYFVKLVRNGIDQLGNYKKQEHVS
ncbi:MAG: radical SAM protein [Bacteroidales bacterium]|nr:radical SAM protein [Bacteroidales bacterium]